MIREASPSDALRLAEIHVAALPLDLLPRIGATFLSERFYPALLGSDHSLVLVEDNGESVRAFVVFAFEPEELMSSVRSPLLPVAWHVGKAALRRPSIAGEVMTIMRGTGHDVAPSIRGRPELYVMATDPAHQSQGIGSQLVDAGLAIVARRGKGCVVKTSSPRARRFYERHGFRLIGTERRAARTLEVLALASPVEP